MIKIEKTGQFTLYALLLVTVIPLVFAIVMYFGNWLVPSDRTNHGQLLLPPDNIKSLNLEDTQGSPWPTVGQSLNWLMLYYESQPCQDTCIEQMRLMRQVHIALGKESGRIQRVLVLPDVSENMPLEQQYPHLQLLQSYNPEQFAMGKGLYIVDPNGNIMMYYPANDMGQAVRKDLKKLLRNSTIG
jgi:hypothetical protein